MNIDHMKTFGRKVHIMTGKLCIKTVLAIAVLLYGFGTVASAQAAQTEDQLIATLKSDAGWQPKYEACTALRQIGTKKSVPALAKLLSDPKLGHMARYALEPMNSPEAGKALRDGFKRTKGQLRLGVATSLGVRRDEKAISSLTRGLKDKDPDVAAACAGALGRIGSAKAVAALLKAENKASDAVRPAIHEGLLVAAELLSKSGDAKLATKISETLDNSNSPKNIQLAAFRSLAYADPNMTARYVLKALDGDDPVMRDVASQIVAETKGESDTKAYCDAIERLRSDGKVALVRGLGQRGDTAALPVVAVLTGVSSDKPVQLASIAAVAKLGSGANVPSLVALLAVADADISGEAKLGLESMKAKDVDAAIAAAAPAAAPPVRTQLVTILTTRMAKDALPLSKSSLTDSDAAVRIAALHSIGQLGGKAEIPDIIAALQKSKDAAERTEASSALSVICAMHKDEVLPEVLGALKKANPETKVVLLRALGEIGNPKALDAVVASLNVDNQSVSSEAIKVLGNWKSGDAAPHLLKLAQSSNATRKDVGLRGYVRLAQAEQNVDAKIKMLETAMKLASKTEEKWVVLAAWGSLADKRALDAVTPYLDKKEVHNEAGSAIVSIARELGKRDEASKAASVAALKLVQQKCDNDSIKDRAQKTLVALGGA
jgi:HEAT repeat protein